MATRRPRRDSRAALAIGLGAVLGLACAAPPDPSPPGSRATPTFGNAPETSFPHPELEERTIAQLQTQLEAGRWTSANLVDAYEARVAAIDHGGPTLRSVLALNPEARDAARALDEERATEGPRGPLHGIPVLIKDNIETRELPTTAGSLALAGNRTGRDAPLVARLREAGMVVLGKANLSEWANIRSTHSTSGWSAMGGLTRNPYALDRNPCGSSSGSAVAVAANLVPVAVGTETDGSITCPAATNGIVGLKPTVGLISRTHVVPISHSQDTAGPMGRTVPDVAALLSVMAGTDPADPATAEADEHRLDYAAALSGASLAGRRIGVLRFSTGYHPALDREFEAALGAMRDAGAQLVEIPEPPHTEGLGGDELLVLLAELRADLASYLASAAPGLPVRALEDVAAFNREHAEVELALFGQELFEQAIAGPSVETDAYRTALASNRRRAGPEGIDRMLADYDVALLVAPTGAPAWTTDVVNGDHFLGSASQWAAIAGYPHLTVPMGTIQGLPVGISFIGPAWSEAELLAAGHAFERVRPARRSPQFWPSVSTWPTVGRALEPSRG